MRLARNVLEGVAGLEIFPIIGILIFLSFFVGVLVWVMKMKASTAEDYSKIPLEGNDFAGEETVNKEMQNQQNKQI